MGRRSGVKVHIRFLQVLRNGDRALEEGVLGDGLVRVDWTQAFKGHDLVVGGIPGCIFYHVELKRQKKRAKLSSA